jgi:hypothetical protein
MYGDYVHIYVHTSIQILATTPLRAGMLQNRQKIHAPRAEHVTPLKFGDCLRVATSVENRQRREYRSSVCVSSLRPGRKFRGRK